MSGSSFGGGVRNQYFNFDEPQDVGHCFIALRPDLFMPMETYQERMSELERRCKASPRASGFDDIQMPGEPEARTEAARLRDGIPIEADETQPLREEAGHAGLELPSPLPCETPQVHPLPQHPRSAQE